MDRILIAAAALLLSATGASSQPPSYPPSVGLLKGTTGDGFIDYECSSLPDGRLRCDFVQVLLRVTAKPEDLAETLAEVPTMLSDPETLRELEALCPFAIGLRSYFDTGSTELLSAVPEFDAAKIAELAEITGFERATMVSFANHTSNFCADRTEQNLAAMFTAMHNAGTTTCEPFVNKYQQDFVRVSEELWVVDTSPQGDCGIVNTSRFVAAPEGIFWNYTASKVITNKAGKINGLLSCGELDERQYEYTWNAPKKQVNCVFLD